MTSMISETSSLPSVQTSLVLAKAHTLAKGLTLVFPAVSVTSYKEQQETQYQKREQEEEKKNG